MMIAIVLCADAPALDLALVRHVLNAVDDSAGRALVTVQIRSATGLPVTLSDGATRVPDETGWDKPEGFDLVLILSGPAPLNFLSMGLRGFLLRAARSGATLGGIGCGTHVLAETGLLKGREAVLAGDLSRYATPLWPDIARSDADFVVERDRLTAKGGLTVTQAMLAWLSAAIAPDLFADVSRRCCRGPQGIAPEPVIDPVLRRMRAVMAAHIDAPIPLTAIAHHLDMSAKQMRARCQNTEGKGPAQVYLELRLDRARRLVHETGQSVREIAAATGFASPSSFTRRYKAHFGETPRDWRGTQARISRAPAYRSPAPQESL
ncbi:GlxA family transcriptional regulator [Pacificoceanicola onchidii]|uniref:GlxA family transcriptional regulator n=1 Tax=Pacificoceanicola onchidii TaxID=2562685 RepID=UPI001455FCD8|nr:helix-turn-helix domain-containing protein [Pacificoceanicola onchidii]